MRAGLLLLVICALPLACSKFGERPEARRGGRVPVVVARAEQKTVPLQLRAIGTVQPTESVTVRSRIAGELTRIHFKEGQDVKEGALLFAIDPRTLHAELRQTEANLARNSAELENARREAARFLRSVADGAVRATLRPPAAFTVLRRSR